MNHRYSFLLFALLLLLAACGGSETPQPDDQTPNPTPSPVIPPTPPPSTDPSSISGTVTAPGDVSDTFIVGCLSTDVNCASPATAVTDATGNYVLANLPAGSYIVIAWKDVNGTQEVDNGDYLGAYPSVQSPTPVTPPASSINITMQVYNDGTTPPDPVDPVDPGPGTGFSGTLSAAPGGDVAGTQIGACPVVGDAPDCSSAPVFIDIAQSGSSIAYSLDDVPSGLYAVIALQDVDGDGNPDFLGVYESSQSITYITPPRSDVNIQLEPAANFASASVSGLDKLGVDEFDLGALQKLLE